MGENGHIFPPLVPNQALYQAEPQPELIRQACMSDRRAAYFAYFAADSKELALRPDYKLLCHCCTESKRGTISRMKHWRITLIVLAALLAPLAMADDFKTINGKEKLR